MSFTSPEFLIFLAVLLAAPVMFAVGWLLQTHLLNRVLGDIYGPQELLRSGAIPPSIIFGHSGYLHQVQGTLRQAGRARAEFGEDGALVAVPVRDGEFARLLGV